MPLRRTPCLIGFALLAGALLWRTSIAPRWTQRIPPGWSLSTDFVGTQTYADSLTGRLPQRDVPGYYERRITVVSDSGRPHVVRLRHAVTIREPVAQRVTWEYITDELVDPRTGARAEPEFAGDIALFPRNVERRSYRIRTNYLEGQRVDFERVEDIGGLSTYLFSHRGRGDFGRSYVGTPSFPGIAFKPGQELRCKDDQFYLRVWVEPLTGAMVKLEEGCPSGDYVYDVATGQALFAVDRWRGSSAGTGLSLRVEQVQRERLRLLMVDRVIPLALGLAGLAFLLLGSIPPLVARAS